MVKTSRFVVLLVVLIALLASTATAALAAPKTPVRQTTAVSAFERQVLTQINVVRNRHRLAPLRMSTPLSTAADTHSLKMGRLGFFAHESSDGSSFWKRVQRFYGWKGYRMWAVGENLLWASPEIDAAAAVQMWMESPGHRANLLSKQWREIGLSAVFIPAAPGVYGGRDVTIVTADFGIRR